MIRVNRPDYILEQPRVMIWEETNPTRIAESRAVDEAARRNGDWLQTHWHEVMPHGLGKFLAVAGQEAFLADSPREAVALARAAHPDDPGLLIQYLRPDNGPRIYGNRG